MGEGRTNMMKIETVRIDLKRLWRAWELIDMADAKIPHCSPLMIEPGVNVPYRDSLIRAIDSVQETRRVVNACRETLLQECGHTTEEIDKV